ncbi:hypothetical protein JRQ81_017759, partial [Phrynocephalus forsythii]
MAESTAVSIPVPVLKEGGYLLWAYHIELCLKKAGLWGIVKNPPAQPTEAQKQKNDKALAIIGLSVADDQLCIIRGITSAADCWEKLHAVHIRTSASSKVHLSRRL